METGCFIIDRPEAAQLLRKFRRDGLSNDDARIKLLLIDEQVEELCIDALNMSRREAERRKAEKGYVENQPPRCYGPEHLEASIDHMTIVHLTQNTFPVDPNSLKGEYVIPGMLEYVSAREDHEPQA